MYLKGNKNYRCWYRLPIYPIFKSVLADELALAYISKKKDVSLLSNKIKWRSLSESTLLELNENLFIYLQ